MASSAGLGHGIFLLDRNAHITKVAAPGDPAPSGGTFDFLTNPWINDRGDIAFVGHLRGQECTNDRDLRSCPMSVFLKSTGEAIKCLARPGTPSVGTLLRYAWAPMLNSRGDVVFMGELEARSGIAHPKTNYGIHIYSWDADRPIAVPGDIMPDGRKIAAVNPSRSNRGFSFNNRGDVVFSAALENGDSGMYAYWNEIFHTILATGTVIPDIGTVSGIPNSSIEAVLNDRGQILFSTQLSDGKTVLGLASPSK